MKELEEIEELKKIAKSCFEFEGICSELASKNDEKIELVVV